MKLNIDKGMVQIQTWDLSKNLHNQIFNAQNFTQQKRVNHDFFQGKTAQMHQCQWFINIELSVSHFKSVREKIKLDMCKLTKKVSNFFTSTQILDENALFSGKIYTVGKKITPAQNSLYI